MIAENASPATWQRYLLRLSVPVMLSNSMIALVGVVDTAIMGRMGSPEWIAATGVGALLFNSIYWLFAFLRMGTGGLVAQAFGANNLEETGRITLRALGIALVFALLLLIVQGPILAVGLSALSDAQDWKPLTEVYFSIRIYSAPATLMLFALTGTLIGLQRMKQVLFLQLLLNALNIALNIGFFTFTQLNIAGVAWATLISEYITLLFGFYLSRDVLLKAWAQKPVLVWLLDAQACKRYFVISGNLFIRTLCLIFVMYWMTVLGSRISVNTLVVNTVLMHMVNLTALCLDGYAQAIETLTGYSVGQKNIRMFKRAAKTATQLAAVTALLFSLVFWFWGDALVALMSADLSVQDMTAEWLPWVIVLPLIGVWSFLLDGIFIGATQTAHMRNSMFMALLMFGVASMVLVPILGNHGIWLSYHIMFLVRTVTLAWYWPDLLWHMKPAT